MARPPGDIDARFRQQFTASAADECWIWRGTTINSGYGHFWVSGTKKMTAHRFAFKAANGFLPPVVRHTCDIKLCVNPGHLVAGTSADNMRDMVERKRMGGGAAWRLTADQVTEIRRRFVAGDHGRGGNRKQLAEEFGVKEKTIWAIARGRIGDYRIRAQWGS